MQAPGLPDVRVLARPSGATSRVAITLACDGARLPRAAASSPSNESSDNAAGVSQSPQVLSRGNDARSISVTACPRVARCQPADAPAGPAPTIAIRALRAEVTSTRRMALCPPMLHNRRRPRVDGARSALYDDPRPAGMP